MFRTSSVLVLVTFILCATKGLSQPSNDGCVDAMFLCPGLDYSGSNQGASADTCANCEDGATGAGNFCFELDNTVWYTFQTNSNGGDATVSLSGISCLSNPGQDNELQAMVLEATTPCDESTYTLVGSCNAGQQSAFDLPLTGLQPNSTYYVQIDGAAGGGTIPAECDFNISVNGAAVEPEISFNTIDENCGTSDGTTDITVTGGSAPYNYSIDGGTSYQAGSFFNGLQQGGYDVVIEDDNGCLFYEPLSVGVANGPVIGVPIVTDASCGTADGEIDVTTTAGGTAPYSFTVNGNPQGSGVIQNLNAGSYTVVVTDASGCSDSAQIQVASQAGVQDATTIITEPSCGGGTNGEIEVNANAAAGSAPLSYSINGQTAQGSNVFAGLTAGSYDIVITDANGCAFTIEGVVVSETEGTEVLDVQLTADPSPSCDGDPVEFEVTVNTSGTIDDISFVVNGAVQQSGTGTSYTYTSLNADSVQVIVSASGGCLAQTSASSILIVQSVLPNETGTVTITSSASDACEGEPVTFVADQIGCTDPIYAWYVNGLLQTGISSDTFTTSFTENVQVYAEVTCANACSSPSQSNTEQVNITVVSADAGEDQVILEGESTVLEGSGNGTSYQWSPYADLSDPTSLDPIADPIVTTTYTLTVTNGNCTATDEMILVVTPPIVAPNTITPNGDGYNDTWLIQNIQNYPACRVTIYDRWGQQIYTTIGYTNSKPWDGTNRGKKIPPSVYYYVIELNSGASRDVDKIAGTITVLY